MQAPPTPCEQDSEIPKPVWASAAEQAGGAAARPWIAQRTDEVVSGRGNRLALRVLPHPAFRCMEVDVRTRLEGWQQPAVLANQ
mgnify:CR=1 FL=1|jgi:hypothetical protein